jgi:hypothetical protein
MDAQSSSAVADLLACGDGHKSFKSPQVVWGWLRDRGPEIRMSLGMLVGSVVRRGKTVAVIRSLLAIEWMRPVHD